MTSNKDLKRRVRARMEKTGEAYTTARMHVVDRQEEVPSSDPVPENYLDLAGVSDETVREKTGRDWLDWVHALDAVGAREMKHKDIARWVEEQTGLAWWAQSVAVGYERIRGLRDVGQQRSGQYEVSRSKTVAVPVARLYEAFVDESLRSRWLDVDVTVTKSTPDKSVRMKLPDGSPAEAYLSDKGAEKSSVTMQQRKLPSKEAADEAKAAWAERLKALAVLLG